MQNRKMVYSALFIALGIIIPIAFHAFGTTAGSMFLPMHIPVILAGAFLGPLSGMVVGALTPLLSSFFTGMPPVLPMLPIMFVELMVYGAAMGYLYHKQKYGIYSSLIITLILGRVAVGIDALVLVHLFGIGGLPSNPLLYVQGSFLKGLPGIAIQLVLIPVLLKYLHSYQRESI
ncbi:MAG TPA: ECF transporter S component [Halanaerobiales bacterium]|nr:ECF transporter S component [Halanaerobiales bacterium]